MLGPFNALRWSRFSRHLKSSKSNLKQTSEHFPVSVIQILQIVTSLKSPTPAFRFVEAGRGLNTGVPGPRQLVVVFILPSYGEIGCTSGVARGASLGLKYFWQTSGICLWWRGVNGTACRISLPTIIPRCSLLAACAYGKTSDTSSWGPSTCGAST